MSKQIVKNEENELVTQKYHNESMESFKVEIKKMFGDFTTTLLTSMESLLKDNRDTIFDENVGIKNRVSVLETKFKQLETSN